MDFISVNDELLAFKQRMRSLNKEVIKIEKIGNGNMSAFQVFYRDSGEQELRTAYFWRHDIDGFFERWSANK